MSPSSSHRRTCDTQKGLGCPSGCAPRLGHIGNVGELLHIPNRASSSSFGPICFLLSGLFLCPSIFMMLTESKMNLLTWWGLETAQRDLTLSLLGPFHRNGAQW